MDELSERRVAEALNANPDAQLVAISALDTAERLHQFILNYDFNNGVSPAFAVLTNPSCGAGTALCLYGLCWPGFDNKVSRCATANPEFDFEALRAAISECLSTTYFASDRIFFDPAEEFSKVQMYKLRKESAKHLLAIGSEKIKRAYLW